MAEWAKISVGMFRDPAVLALKVPEREAFIRLILWSVEQETDGHIPEVVLPAIGVRAPQVEALCGVDLVRANGSGWVIRSYDKHQEPSSSMDARRQAAKRAARARWDRRADA